MDTKFYFRNAVDLDSVNVDTKGSWRAIWLQTKFSTRLLLHKTLSQPIPVAPRHRGREGKGARFETRDREFESAKGSQKCSLWLQPRPGLKDMESPGHKNYKTPAGCNQFFPIFMCVCVRLYFYVKYTS